MRISRQTKLSIPNRVLENCLKVLGKSSNVATCLGLNLFALKEKFISILLLLEFASTLLLAQNDIFCQKFLMNQVNNNYRIRFVFSENVNHPVVHCS